MLVVLSPAKTLDYDTPTRLRKHTLPQFSEDTGVLVDKMRAKSPAKIKKMMGVSDAIAKLNFERYQNFSSEFTADNSRQAVLAFMGDVYAGLDAHSLSSQELNYAQKHLRILSGLYGILRPLDRMQPYRLEMGTTLSNPRGRDLYRFWGRRIADALNEQAEKNRTTVLINLASNEYFKSVDRKTLDLEVVSPTFKDFSSGQYRVLSFFAKKARGLMARYIIQTRAQRPEDLQGFDIEGYRFNAEMSTPQKPVFTRDER